jgi:Flp pilus assembly protein TadG
MVHLSRERSEHGAVAILVAILSLSLFGLAALVVDLGHARDVSRQAANASDAAALAAGNALWTNSATPQFTAAVANAKSYVAANFPDGSVDWASCSDPGKLVYVPSGSTPCVSFDSATSPTEVRVKLPTTSVTFGFGKLVGMDAKQATRAPTSG